MEHSEEVTKYQKVKQHLKDNKKVYIAAVGGAAVGAIGIFVATGGHVTIVEAFKGVHIQYKSPNLTIVELERRACREPIPVRYKLTGEAFASINRAAEVTGKNARDIARDVRGMSEQFERLPDSVLA